MISVCRTFTFEAAHQLPRYDGKCSQVHGHSYKLEVEIACPVSLLNGYLDPQDAMVVDFNTLESVVNNEVIRLLDHQMINNQIDIAEPTAEMLVLWIVEILKKAVWSYSNPDRKSVHLNRIRLYETEKCYAEWRETDRDEN
jgi:6-pyruvoyltetrahydropterin/6-carboxytetrahydropterin synthase